MIRSGCPSGTKTGILGILLVASVFVSRASASIVYSSDFSTPGNAGTVGGSLLSPNGTSLIGSGPWSGTWTGIAGLLIPPFLTISTSGGSPGGSATISGVLGVNIILLGLVDSTGFFSVSTGVNFLPNTTYQLSVLVDAGSTLTAPALANAGVGIGLTDGSGTLLASSADGIHFLNLSLLSGQTYLLEMYLNTSAVVPSGAIGIRLFDAPSGLNTASLFQNVTFSNVALSEVPEPSANALVGIGLLAFTTGGWLRRRTLRGPLQRGHESFVRFRNKLILTY